MMLRGSAFMIMWHDIEAPSEDDYNAWHTIEHMPERLAIPGFLRGRRGVNWDLDRHRYLTIYESDGLEVLSSEAYLERLNNPSEWTSRIAPAFRNFLRVACQTVSTLGKGVGGAVGTYRINLPSETGAAAWVQDSGGVLGGLLDFPGVSSVHAAFPRRDHSDIETTETRIRPKMGEEGFDALVILETIGFKELIAVDEEVQKALASLGAASVTSHLYSLAFVLGRNADS